jgi:hypothetical protein
MLDDHRYSVGRTVVFRLDDSDIRHGRWAGKASGTVTQVERVDEPEPRWLYTIERQRTKQRVMVREEDILYGVMGKRKPERSALTREDRGERVAGMLDRVATDSALVGFLRTTVHDLVRRETLEEAERREGRELPLAPGDYIRVRGDLRKDLEPYHNYYGKIVDVMEPDIAGLEAWAHHAEPRTYTVIRKYLVLLDDGSRVAIYDPEVKLFYTANGRSTILNWRAAAFLAEAFGDDPPYKLEFSYLEDHIFTREELNDLGSEQLSRLLSSIMYVKGHMGWRDFQEQQRHFSGLSLPYLLDSVLAASRFDHRRNREMTPAEIEEKCKQAGEFRRLLGH